MTGFIESYGYESGEWSDAEKHIWDELTEGNPEAFRSEEAQLLYHEAMFDTNMWTGENVEIRAAMEDALSEYLERFDIDFDMDFDWIEYREWYDGQ